MDVPGRLHGPLRDRPTNLGNGAAGNGQLHGGVESSKLARRCSSRPAGPGPYSLGMSAPASRNRSKRVTRRHRCEGPSEPVSAPARRGSTSCAGLPPSLAVTRSRTRLRGISGFPLAGQCRHPADDYRSGREHRRVLVSRVGDRGPQVGEHWASLARIDDEGARWVRRGGGRRERRSGPARTCAGSPTRDSRSWWHRQTRLPSEPTIRSRRWRPGDSRG